MRAVALVAVCACNQTFGLHDTRTAVDAAPRCPAIGTPPVFRAAFHQVTDQWCYQYSPSPDANLALAICNDGGTRVESGPIDQPLAPLDLVQLAGCDFSTASPRLAPEGDRAFVHAAGFGCPLAQGWYELARVDATWAVLGPIGISEGDLLDSVTRAPHRHAMLNTKGELHEVVQRDDGGWDDQLPPYTTSTLGLTMLQGAANLSPDGLHLVLHDVTPDGHGTLYYADRPTLDDRFSMPVPQPDWPDTRDAVITDDCSRLYFSGVQRVFFMEEQ